MARIPVDADTYLRKQIPRLENSAINHLKRFGIASTVSMASFLGGSAGGVVLMFEELRQIKKGTALLRRRDKIIRDLTQQ